MEIKLMSNCLSSLKKRSVVSFICTSLTMLLLISNTAFAAADWEWSQDKGWAQSSGRALPNPAEQLKYAYKLEKEGRFLNASKQYFLLLKAFPDSDEAGVGLQRLANCLFMMENYYDAYKALEQVIKSYPFSAEKSDLIKIEFLIGRKFQAGARVNLLDDMEDPAVGKRAAIEIFESVVANDSVGPYAGASLLAIASCYKDLDEPARGIVYADRVLTEFSMSPDLVAKARIIKKTMEVMLGNADINSVRVAVNEAKKAAAEDGGEEGDADFAPVDDYDSEIRELEEIQAKKLWDSAEYYRKRGTRDSTIAYKFSLEQIMVRFPNTSYASKARRIIGDVKIAEKKESSGKFNIPFITKKPPTFVAASNSEDYVHSDDVPVPGIDSDIPDEDLVAAVALPKGNSEVPMGADYATPKTKNQNADIVDSQEGGFDEFDSEEDISQSVNAEDDFETPPIPRSNGEIVEEVEVETKVESKPVPVASNGPIAPVGAGSTAVPLGAVAMPRTQPQYDSAPVYEEQLSGSGYQDDPFGASPASPVYDTAPESIKTQTSASAIPMSMRRDTSIVEKAQSKARVKANETAADSNDWSFSEEF